MANVAVIGAQWGDEGKGKVVDWLASRADIVVLPYRNIEQSGVLYTALAFGRPLVLSSVGGFTEIGERGAARLVPPEDPDELAEAITELIADRDTAAALAAGAEREASTISSWDRIAESTMALYRDLR